MSVRYPVPPANILVPSQTTSSETTQNGFLQHMSFYLETTFVTRWTRVRQIYFTLNQLGRDCQPSLRPQF